MTAYRECISSRPVTFIYRYIFIPFFLLFISLGVYIALSDPTATIKDYLFLFIILAPPIFFALYILKMVKIAYIDTDGIYYNNYEIPWSNVKKIKFYFISPPLMIIKYEKGNSSNYAFWCILPLSKYNYVKNLVLTLKKTH